MHSFLAAAPYCITRHSKYACVPQELAEILFTLRFQTRQCSCGGDSRLVGWTKLHQVRWWLWAMSVSS